MSTDQAVLAAATDQLADLVDLRRRLHRRPEVGLYLPHTQQAVLDALEAADLPVEIAAGSGEVSWVTATLTGTAARPDGDEPVLLLRGDMDALPMPEDTGLDYASTVDGAMHACGHDAHVAMLVGAARVLADRRDELAGTVKFLFQPGEEGHHGARYCIKEGVLDAPAVTAAFALHITPNLPSGVVAGRPGPLLASADEFDVTVVGRGGHASSPHLAADPIPAAAEIVLALQSLITREIDAFDPAVLTVASMRAGTATNVIAETARLEGTIRAVSDRTRDAVHAGLVRVANHVAEAHGCHADVDLAIGYPVTVNNGAEAARAAAVVRSLLGQRAYLELRQPMMGAEDWSYVLERVPGSMAFLGVCPPGQAPATAASVHSNRMTLDEDAMAIGTAVHAAVALNRLQPEG
ncbi:MAG: M20 family metallopeptidase [Acidimicrobiales bacterium]